jgi:hypothetical protein
VDIELADPIDPNGWLAAYLVQHWTELKSALGDPIERVSLLDPGGAWEVLAPFAASHPECREDCLTFIRDKGTGGRPELLSFLAQVRPGSAELLQALIEAVDGTVVDRSPMRQMLLTGAELLADQFGSRHQEPPPPLRERLAIPGPPSPGLFLALALGWPNSDALGELVQAINSGGRLPIDVDWRARIAISPAAMAADSFSWYLNYATTQTPYLPAIPGVLFRRLARDPDFRRELESLVGPDGTPAQWVTVSRLLAGIGRLSGHVRAAVEQRCDQALDGDEVDVLAFDLIAAEVRPLGLGLLDALEGLPD